MVDTQYRHAVSPSCLVKATPVKFATTSSLRAIKDVDVSTPSAAVPQGTISGELKNAVTYFAGYGWAVCTTF